jgi:hypothetical protein
MTCKFNADTSDGLKIVSDTSGEIDLQIDGTTKVHMDSGGQIGIGTTSPSGSLHINTSSANILIADTDDSGGSYSRVRSDASGSLHLEADVGNNTGSSTMRFNMDGSEKMRMDSDGNFYVGTTGSAPWTATSGTFARIGNTFPLTATNAGIVAIFNRNTSTGTCVEYKQAANVVGSVSVTASNTSYNTSSDYRLKENVNYSFDATTRLKQLKPCRFNWIIDDTNTAVDGFLAHEVSSIVPEAITGEKDATKLQDVYDDDGNVTGTETVPDYQGIDQSKLVPLLVKTIQELEARITALESE